MYGSYGNYGNVKSVFTGISDSEIGLNVLAQMRDIIIQSAKNPDIIHWARAIVEHCPWKNSKCEIDSIFNYLRAHIRYVHDTLGTEYIETPLEALKMIGNNEIWQGDCDDFTVLSLSLYRAIGYSTIIRAVAFDEGNLSHVYGLVQSGSQWIPIDLIALRGYVGFEKKPYTRKLDYAV